MSTAASIPTTTIIINTIIWTTIINYNFFYKLQYIHIIILFEYYNYYSPICFIYIYLFLIKVINNNNNKTRRILSYIEKKITISTINLMNLLFLLLNIHL